LQCRKLPLLKHLDIKNEQNLSLDTTVKSLLPGCTTCIVRSAIGDPVFTSPKMTNKPVKDIPDIKVTKEEINLILNSPNTSSTIVIFTIQRIRMMQRHPALIQRQIKAKE
jgi:hypothetical protein